jgi:hypothetical protein
MAVAKRAAGQIYVVSYGPQAGQGSVASYSLSGSPINPSLITGLYSAGPTVAFGGNLFISQGNNGYVAEYSTSGALINPNFISQGFVDDLTFSGNYWYTSSWALGVIRKYTASGTLVNASLVPGNWLPDALAVSGNSLFVANDSGKIAEYTTDGQVINDSFVDLGANKVTSMTVVGSFLYVGYLQRFYDGTLYHPVQSVVARYAITTGQLFGSWTVPGMSGAELDAQGNSLYVGSGGVLREYTFTGSLINGSVINPLSGYVADVAIVPEPSTGVLTVAGLFLLSLRAFSRFKNTRRVSKF